MNLSKAPIHIPDVTRAARAGAAIGNETANQLRAFAALGQQMRESNARTSMAWNDQAMNLRERQQRLNQSADLHPYQILQAQESVMSQNLSNQLTQQQLAHNVSKHEVDQLNALADLTGKEARNTITKKSLEDQIQQDSEAPTLQAAINAIRSYANDPKNADVDTLNKVTSAGLSGRNLEVFNSAMDEASQVILNRRDDDAVGIAYRSQQQDLAALMQSGALLVQDKDDPAKISAAKAVHRRNRVNAILDEFDGNSVPKSGSRKAQTLEGRHTKQNGFLDEGAFRQALASDAGYTKTSMSVDDTTGASRTTYSRTQSGYTGRKPMSQKEYIEAVQEVRAASAGLDGKPTLTVDEAKKQVDAMVNPSAKQTGSGKSVPNDFIHDLAQMMFASSRADDGWWDSDVGEYTDEATGREYLGKQGLGLSPNADSKMTEYREKLDKSGVSWSPVAGLPGTPKPNRVYWAWQKNKSGGIDMQAWLYKFDKKGNPVRTTSGGKRGYDVENILMKSGQMDGNIF